MERFIFLLKAKVANKLNQKRHSKRILLFQEKAVISERYILCLERGSNYKTHTHTHTHAHTCTHTHTHRGGGGGGERKKLKL